MNSTLIIFHNTIFVCVLSPYAPSGRSGCARGTLARSLRSLRANARFSQPRKLSGYIEHERKTLQVLFPSFHTSPLHRRRCSILPGNSIESKRPLHLALPRLVFAFPVPDGLSLSPLLPPPLFSLSFSLCLESLGEISRENWTIMGGPRMCDFIDLEARFSARSAYTKVSSSPFVPTLALSPGLFRRDEFA